MVMVFYDKIWIVYDVKNDGCLGIEVDYDYLGVVIMNFKKMLESLDYFEKGDWSYDLFEFKLKGWLWWFRGEVFVKMWLMVLWLLEMMELMGWRVYVIIL